MKDDLATSAGSVPHRELMLIATGEEKGGILEPADLDTVHRHDGVAGTKPGGRGGRPGRHRVDDHSLARAS